MYGNIPYMECLGTPNNPVRRYDWSPPGRTGAKHPPRFGRLIWVRCRLEVQFRNRKCWLKHVKAKLLDMFGLK